MLADLGEFWQRGKNRRTREQQSGLDVCRVTTGNPESKWELRKHITEEKRSSGYLGPCGLDGRLWKAALGGLSWAWVSSLVKEDSHGVAAAGREGECCAGQLGLSGLGTLWQA